MLGILRPCRDRSDDPTWLRPIDPRRITPAQVASSVKRAVEVTNPDAAARRIACMAQHPAARSRRQAVAWAASSSISALDSMSTPEERRVCGSAPTAALPTGRRNPRRTGPTRMLVERVEDLHRRVSRSRARDSDDTPLVGGMLGHDRAILLFHDEVSFSTSRISRPCSTA